MSIVCCFGCLTLCGCKNIICRRLVFFPPKAMYEMETQPDGSQVMWLHSDPDAKTGEVRKEMPYSSPNFMLHMVKTARNNQIAVMYIRYPNSKFTILFSHGNATDNGCMRDHLIDVAVQLEVSVVCYDYSGYGLSTGKCTTANVFADAEAALEQVRNVYRVPINQIVLYGQSLGTAPSLHLATKFPAVGGLILHSALMSGLRVIRPITKTHWFDIFPNIDRIKKVSCPTFIIHGTEDEAIPHKHGQTLAEACPRAALYDTWWVPGANHNNIEVHWRVEYFQKLRAYFRFLETGKKIAPEVAAKLQQERDAQLDAEDDGGDGGGRLRGESEGKEPEGEDLLKPSV